MDSTHLSEFLRAILLGQSKDCNIKENMKIFNNDFEIKKKGWTYYDVTKGVS